MSSRLGIHVYRFSISWPRVLPEAKETLNPKGIDFYSRFVDALLEKGITPMPKLHHWDLPQAIQDEIPVKGYLHWSLMDNFEWAFGYRMRFGLVHVDFDAMERTIKESGHRFAELASQNKLLVGPRVQQIR